MESYYLGVDPSTKSTGYGVFNQLGELVDYGVITPKKGRPNLRPEEEMYIQYLALKELIEKYMPKQVVCEDQFMKTNVDTLKKLSRVTGNVLLISAQHGIPVELVYPSSWRKVFHGTGKAKKEDTINKVNGLFELGLKKKDNDIADAIGIAAYALQMSVNQGA